MRIISNIVLLFGFCLVACSSSERIDNSIKSPVYLDYSITISSGGGFTGNHEGIIIDSLGIVSSVQGIILSRSPKIYKGKLGQEQILEINKLLPSIFNIKYKENGNMTTSITLTKDKKSLSFSWEGIGISKNVPSALAEFYKIINNSISQLNK